MGVCTPTTDRCYKAFLINSSAVKNKTSCNLQTFPVTALTGQTDCTTRSHHTASARLDSSDRKTPTPDGTRCPADSCGLPFPRGGCNSPRRGSRTRQSPLSKKAEAPAHRLPHTETAPPARAPPRPRVTFRHEGARGAIPSAAPRKRCRLHPPRLGSLARAVHSPRRLAVARVGLSLSAR